MKIGKVALALLLSLLILFSISACSLQQDRDLTLDKLIAQLAQPQKDVLDSLELTESDLEEFHYDAYPVPLSVEIRHIPFDIRLGIAPGSEAERLYSFELSKIYNASLNGKTAYARDLSSLGAYLTEVYGTPLSKEKAPTGIGIIEEDGFYFGEHSREEIAESLIPENEIPVKSGDYWDITESVPKEVLDRMQAYFVETDPTATARFYLSISTSVLQNESLVSIRVWVEATH